jgi:hypothetical protein
LNLCLVLWNQNPKRSCSYRISRTSNAPHLGSRIEAPFDDENWYRFGRHQNIDKQAIPKLIVAQTVPRMRVCFDDQGDFYLNNVRVNGILTSERTDPWFLLGILNATVVDFVFRRIAKVKAGGFFEANKQFIAPLPIPNVLPEQAADIAHRAENLQASHTARRDKLVSLAKRMATVRRRSKPETWLFPGLHSKREFEADAPASLDIVGRREWASRQFKDALEARHSAIKQRLSPGAALDAFFVDGELSFSIDGITVIDRIFESEADGTFILAQWKVLATTISITEKTTGEKLCNALRKLATNDGSPAVAQIMAQERELAIIEADINRQERALHGFVNG